MYVNELLDFIIKKDRKWKEVVAKFNEHQRPTAYASKILGRAAACNGKPIYKDCFDIVTVNKPAKKDIKHIYQA